MTLLRDLLNTGILANDATILEANFANEPDFLNGLETISRILATQEIPSFLPLGGEPWKTIHTVLLNANGSGLDVAFAQSLACWDMVVQNAIISAVTFRAQEIQRWLAQSQNTGKKRKTADYIQSLKNLGYNFKFNTCMQSIEVNGNKISTLMRKTIRTQLRDHGIWDVGIAEDAYEAEALKNKYHPVKDYLCNLKFEGGDPISDLAGYFTFEYGMFPVWLRRWLIGACAKVMLAAENRMLVLDGPQNIGKSEFAKWLASPLDPQYFIESGIDTGSEEIYRRLSQKWIWEVSELGSSTRKSDWEALKAFITCRQVTVRFKYDREDSDMPAMANLIGTINNEEGFMPVNDRRFFVERVTAINWEGYKKNIDCDQVWAQAFELYLAGESWEPDAGENSIARGISEEYRMLDLVEETIKRFFVIDPINSISWMSTTEIMDVMKDPYRGNLKGAEIDTRKLARALTKLGLDKPRLKRNGGSSERGYLGIRLVP